jgi:dipeptidyl aminopeptidase/acylaminoacyl peptidase
MHPARPGWNYVRRSSNPGVESELVVFPREGHSVREREHQPDAWRRTIDWFDRYLGSPR